MPSNVIQIRDAQGNAKYPITDVSLVIGLPAIGKGDTASRPTLTADDAGALYYDESLGKYITWNGTAWVNMDGTAL